MTVKVGDRVRLRTDGCYAPGNVFYPGAYGTVKLTYDDIDGAEIEVDGYRDWCRDALDRDLFERAVDDDDFYLYFYPSEFVKPEEAVLPEGTEAIVIGYSSKLDGQRVIVKHYTDDDGNPRPDYPWPYHVQIGDDVHVLAIDELYPVGR